MRHMVAHDARNHADDVFDSTHFKSTPFKNLTSEAAKLGGGGWVGGWVDLLPSCLSVCTLAAAYSFMYGYYIHTYIYTYILILQECGIIVM